MHIAKAESCVLFLILLVSSLYLICRDLESVHVNLYMYIPIVIYYQSWVLSVVCFFIVFNHSERYYCCFLISFVKLHSLI
jgi:hypothetical protein